MNGSGLPPRRLLVTGGCGFIGSNFIHFLLREHPDVAVVNLDKLTYAGNPDNLRDLEGDSRYRFIRGDIADADVVEQAMVGVDAVVNFAAETHVDRSLFGADDFIRTDVHGTYVLLRAAQVAGAGRFIQVSTDEVYGDVPPGKRSRESDPLHPRSPYAASKAGGEMQCIAFWETYRLPVIITRASNNVGPRQHPEKAVPLFVTNALRGEPLPVYGDGRQRRDWLYVEDHCRALDLLLRRGEPGEVYNIGADNERENVEVAALVLRELEKPLGLIRHVEDRPGHDRRYALDSSKLRALSWAPRHGFEEALRATVRWYVENEWWWRRVREGDFARFYAAQYGHRLGGATGG